MGAQMSMTVRRWLAIFFARIITRRAEQDMERKAFYDAIYAKIDAGGLIKKS